MKVKQLRFLVLFIFIANINIVNAQPISKSILKEIPKISVLDISGNSIPLHKIVDKGKVNLIITGRWGDKLPPVDNLTRKIHNEIVSNAKYSSIKVTLLTDEKFESLNSIQTNFKNNGWFFSIYFDSNAISDELDSSVGFSNTFPKTLIIDNKGKIVHVYIGYDSMIIESLKKKLDEFSYLQPVVEPSKKSDGTITNEQLQKAIKKFEYVNAGNEQLKSDLKWINKSIIINDLFLSKFEGKRKTNTYWKYFNENKKLLTEKEEIERKHEENKILRAKEFEEQYSSSSNLKTKTGLNNPTNKIGINSEIKSTFIKSYNGTITYKTSNLTSNCKMTLSKNSDGTYQLKGETDSKNLVSGWDLKGKPIENTIYVFKGDINLFNYAGTSYLFGRTAPINISVKIDEKSMVGSFSIISNDKNIGKQEGIFTLDPQ